MADSYGRLNEYVDPAADTAVSTKMQIFITYFIGGLGSWYFWPSMEPISKGLVCVFAVIAGLSIQNGTWMTNARDLRREQRDERRKAYRDAKAWMTGSSTAGHDGGTKQS